MLKEYFLSDNICHICNLKFDKDSDNKNYISFCNHIKKIHDITLEEYYLQYHLNNECVYCACGCGNKTNFVKGRYLKYYSDHKNLMKPSEDVLFKIKKTMEKIKTIDKLVSDSGLNFDILNKSYDSFISLEKPMSLLSKELYIDPRTLKKYWVKMGLIKNLDLFKRVALKSKIKWMSNPIKPNENVVDILKENIILLKKELVNKNKITFNEIISILGVDVNKNYLSYFLKECLTSSELKKIKFIKSSQIEIDFLNVLKFYFKNVTHSFDLNGKNFDYKIGSKILIELDGDYWHSKEEAKKNDLLKNKIAEENGYILFRISDKKVKSLEFINKINKIYEKFK